MRGRRVTRLVKDRPIQEKLVLISLLIPIVGAIISGVSYLSGVPVSISFTFVIYVYVVFLSAYFWYRDIESDFLEDIKFIKNILLNEREKTTVGIDDWYDEYRKEIRDSEERMWITQNSETSPDESNREEYKEAFEELINKSAESNVDVYWIILPASDGKIRWLLSVLDELSHEDNVEIAVPDLEGKFKNSPFPLIQSFQVIDDILFGIDMQYGRRRVQEGRRINIGRNHFYTQNPVFREQSLRYLRQWWGESEIVSEGNGIKLQNLFYIIKKHSDDTESVMEELANTLNKLMENEDSSVEKKNVEVILQELYCQELIKEDKHGEEALFILMDHTSGVEKKEILDTLSS